MTFLRTTTRKRNNHAHKDGNCQGFQAEQITSLRMFIPGIHGFLPEELIFQVKLEIQIQFDVLKSPETDFPTIKSAPVCLIKA